MSNLSTTLWVLFAAVSIGTILYGMFRSVGRLYWRVVISVLPILLGAVVVTLAVVKYNRGLGGFKLGVDLVGGTILIYEIDPDHQMAEGYKPSDLAAALKRRIDPNDLYNVTIRPLSDTRIEIILPTGGAAQAQKAQAAWNEVLNAVNARYSEKLGGERVEVGRGLVNDLADLIYNRIEAREWRKVLDEVQSKWPALQNAPEAKLQEVPPGARERLIEVVQKGTNNAAKREEVEEIINAQYKPEPLDAIRDFVRSVAGTSQQRKDVTSEEVEAIKAKIRQVGSLEFRVLANEVDDKPVFDAIRNFFNNPPNPAAFAEELERRARNGQPPPLPVPDDGTTDWPTTREDVLGRASYEWVELGKQERENLGLSNRFENEPSELWLRMKDAREKNQVVVVPGTQILLYSRKCQNVKLPEKEREAKKYEYFVLTRLPEIDPDTGERLSVTGQDLVDARPGFDEKQNLAVDFAFNSQGARRFQIMTSKNLPTGGFGRLLAVILDGYVESAATVQSTISSRGQIHGNYTQEKVDALVSVLRSGALPATLKPLPVSENTIGPTLGQDTIESGLRAVTWAFIAVLVFMCVYYRFAGFVATIALLANLLLAVAFMVFVNATFTLPGLAGLVLMLGMAVDANVLIYERLREEREKGAALLQALRNGYERAFPAIIDTHLTSIFTAIVLYTVGNDQLKGFGVSLASGLVISLFTSLYVTKTIFELWGQRNLLKKFSMLKLFSRPNIDFMRIRYYWFTATVALTALGFTIFLVRGPAGLNIDFVGGTAFGGQLKEPTTITELRRLLSEARQEKMLNVKHVQQLDDVGRTFSVTYQDNQTQKIVLANKAAGANRSEMEADVARRASRLPDWSVEQIFLSSEPNDEGKSRFFNVRTTEKEPDLVFITISRLLRDDQGNTLLKQVLVTKRDLANRRATLEFSDFASPGFVKVLLGRELATLGVPDLAFEVVGEGEQFEGRFKRMVADFSAPALRDVTDAQLQSALERMAQEFAERPQPERLENFDAQLAADTQKKALYAILASWVAIVLFLWFRFGNWTFGLAALMCLIHDLLFTLGIIACCHYVVEWAPGLANMLKIDDFKIDLPAVAALLTLVGYSVNDTIVVFDRIREVRGKNPMLTAQMINDSINQTLSRTLLASFTTWLVVAVLYWFGGEGVHLFAFVMVVGVIVGTYSSIYIASPLLLMFGEGAPEKASSPTESPRALTS
jgi:SecD/SecF fusion protein